MNAMQQALLGEVPQVAADGVLGHAKAGHQLRGDDPAVALDPLEDRLSAFNRQHLRVIARTCRFLRLTPRPSRRRTCGSQILEPSENRRLTSGPVVRTDTNLVPILHPLVGGIGETLLGVSNETR